MIYLDYGATTPVHEDVYMAMVPYLTEEYGNPSSKYYMKARKAKDAVEESRYWVARLLNASKEEIIFTAGATESTNMIIKGVADYSKYYLKTGNHIITSKVEHHATLNTCRFLNGEIYSNHDATFSLKGTKTKVNRGFEVDFLDVNQYGQIEPGLFEESIKETSILASFIWGNNEIASLNDMYSLCKVAHSKNIFLHTDATQVLGKIKIDVRDVDIDFLSCSAHKIYGPKGVGAAYIKGTEYGLPPITALIHGGEQEEGIRGGTLAVHDIVGFGKAAELAIERMVKKEKETLTSHKIIVEMISQTDGVELLGDLENRIPGIYSIIVKSNQFNNERFVKTISEEYAISTGSACALGEPSHVLKAIGRGDNTKNVIRVSTMNVKDMKAFLLTLQKYI